MISDITRKRLNRQCTDHKLYFHDNSCGNNTYLNIDSHFGVICCLVVPNHWLPCFSPVEEILLHQIDVFLWVTTGHVVAIYLNCGAIAVNRVVAILKCWIYLEDIFATLRCRMTAKNWNWVLNNWELVTYHDWQMNWSKNIMSGIRYYYYYHVCDVAHILQLLQYCRALYNDM